MMPLGDFCWKDFSSEDFPKLTVADFIPNKVVALANWFTPLREFFNLESFNNAKAELWEVAVESFPDFKGNISLTLKFQYTALSANLQKL